MAESSSWNDVGERFAHLGRTLQDRWAAAGDEGSAQAKADAKAAAEQVDGALDGVRASLDGLADTITRTVNDPQVHDSARAAAGGLVEALGSSLSDLANRIQPPQPDRRQQDPPD